MARSVKCLILAQVMISQPVGSSPASASVLTFVGGMGQGAENQILVPRKTQTVNGWSQI